MTEPESSIRVLSFLLGLCTLEMMNEMNDHSDMGLFREMAYGKRQNNSFFLPILWV